MIRANYETEPHFQPGDLVCHRRYGYRGVVVDLDFICQAADRWYLSNQTQPARNQPWYHVLVDRSLTTTYAAQTSLVPDKSRTPITHPLVATFFNDFVNGQYIRNAQPWPKE